MFSKNEKKTVSLENHIIMTPVHNKCTMKIRKRSRQFLKFYHIIFIFKKKICVCQNAFCHVIKSAPDTLGTPLLPGFVRNLPLIRIG